MWYNEAEPIITTKEHMTITIKKKGDIAQLEQPVPKRGTIGGVSANAQTASAVQATGIEWTNMTWNPMVGCTIHTAGCTNCYAMKQAGKMPPTAKHYEGVVKWVKGNSVWSGKLAQSPPHILNKPKTVKAPSMIFVNSMSDFFHEDMHPQWQLDAMQIMLETPRHVYQILTKRPEYIKRFLAHWGTEFPRNVWVGATMEREDYRDRIDILRDIPAYLRFLSIEPLVGPPGEMNLKGIGWVIIGGESGPGSRPMNVNWVRSAVKQCLDQKVPVFFKQFGISSNNPLFADGVNMKLDPVGKGGSLLDGVSYKEFPKKYEFN